MISTVDNFASFTNADKTAQNKMVFPMGDANRPYLLEEPLNLYEAFVTVDANADETTKEKLSPQDYEMIIVEGDETCLEVTDNGSGPVIEAVAYTDQPLVIGYRLKGSEEDIYEQTIAYLSIKTPYHLKTQGQIVLYDEDFDSRTNIEDVAGIDNINSSVYSIIDDGQRKYLKMSKGSGDYSDTPGFDLNFTPVRARGENDSPMPEGLTNIISPGKDAIMTVKFDVKANESASSNRRAGISLSGMNSLGQVRDTALVYHYGNSTLASYTYGKPAYRRQGHGEHYAG